MQHKYIGKQIIIRLEKDEEIIKSLLDFCNRHNIDSGYFFGIGAVSSAGLSAYDLTRKEYIRRSFDEPMEIASMQGNIALFQNKQVAHCHVVLGRQDSSAIAGHLDKAIISATCEITFHPLSGNLDRYSDEEIGLNLLDLR